MEEAKVRVEIPRRDLPIWLVMSGSGAATIKSDPGICVFGLA